MTIPHDFDDDPEFDPADAGDYFNPPDADVDSDIADSDPSAVQLALLEDGSAVRLTGPGAGSAVTVADGEGVAAGTARLLSRDGALSGRAPLLLIHRAPGTDAFPRAMARIVAATGGRVPIGAVTPLPRATAVSAEVWLQECAAASVRIADPAGFKLDTAVLPGDPPSTRSTGWWPYLGADPMVPADVRDAQRQVGANLLLSPGRAPDPADPQNSLDRVFAEADQALAALQPGERLALNLTLHRTWLTREVLRDLLLAQLLDQEQFDVWYVRVQWPSARATEQPVDAALLEGYKRLAQLAADEERVLLLPQTSFTGWLQLAFGASGFGTGLPGSDQAFKEPIRGGSGAVAIERYFEPTLLHAVERTVHDTLRRQSGYVPCTCPYCPALHAATEWRPDLARLHQLHCTGLLTADAATSARGGAEGAVRRAVRAAVAAAAAQPLAGASEPRHLRVWDRLL